MFVIPAYVLLFFCGCSNDTGQKSNSFLTEITDQVNLDFVHDPAIDGKYYMPESIGSGAAFFDYDNDDDLDIYLLNGAIHEKTQTNNEPIRNRLYRQEDNGTFTDVTSISGLGDQGYGMGVAIGDIDNDGDLDVYISNDGPDALYLNNGNGTFSDITQASGIHNPDWGISVTFVDYNLDSFLDICVANYVDYDTAVVCVDRLGAPDYCGPQGFPGYADRLFKNNGDGTFKDVSVESGIAAKPSAGLGIISADFNDDFYPDIYISNDRKYNHLWINQKDGTFRDDALMQGMAINGMGMAEASMGVTLGDVDNDLDLDLFMTHFQGETNTFLRNAGDIGFQDETNPVALSAVSLPFTGFGTGFFDYDLDGDLDLAIVNGRVIRGKIYTDRDPLQYWDHYAEPNLIFNNDGNDRFTDVSDQALPFTSRVENSRALVFGDIDNDGDVDLLVSNEGGRARLYRNDHEKNGNWLIVRAIDPNLKRDMYGAKVIVHSGEKSFLRLVNPGYSFCASNDPRAHFGLGNIDSIDEVRVIWPGGDTEIFKNISPNQIITLKKGQGQDVAD